MQVMFSLMSFRDKLVATFTESMNGVISELKDKDLFPSDDFLCCLAEFLDIVVAIDAMKNFKGSMNNDLSTYKRAISMFPKLQSESEQRQLPLLSFFIATRDQFSLDVKKSLATMNSAAEDFIQDMLNFCVVRVERDNELIPTLKHCFLRVLSLNIGSSVWGYSIRRR
jgi:cytoplasmic FMR1 interacting protein